MEELNSIWVSVGSEAGMILGAVIGGAALFFLNHLKEWMKKRKNAKKESIPRMVENDVEVYKLLSELLLTTKASRALVFQFHNGTHYVNSASQMKMSCTHEIVADGISKEAKSMQNMLISQHAQAVNDIISHPSAIVDINDCDTEELKQILRAQGVEVAVYAPFSRGTDVEGFIGINYLDPIDHNYPGEKLETVREYLGGCVSKCSLKIGYLLRRQK